MACSAAAPAVEYKEGTHFSKVREVQAPADAKRISVEEFFWYGCPHCFHLDSFVEAWRVTKPGDVDFARVPNSLGRDEGIIHDKTFYTAEALGLSDKIHKPLFAAIHEQHQQLFTQASIQSFFTATTGVMPDIFNNTFNGFAVGMKVNRAEGLAKSYGVTSVPTVVVGGKYYTNVAMSGGPTETFKVVNFLIAKVRAERKGK
jgi:thiol:disulfide interchange protein DsbA